jgi:hypothetical protein
MMELYVGWKSQPLISYVYGRSSITQEVSETSIESLHSLSYPMPLGVEFRLKTVSCMLKLLSHSNSCDISCCVGLVLYEYCHSVIWGTTLLNLIFRHVLLIRHVLRYFCCTTLNMLKFQTHYFKGPRYMGTRMSLYVQLLFTLRGSD